MVLRSGSCTVVGVEYVYEGDIFERELGIGCRFRHIASTAKDRESDPITHVYSEFLLPNGNRKRHVMTTAEINEHAERFSPSARKKDGAWNTSWKAMAAKTVLRQPILRGLIPIELTECDKEAFKAEGPLDSLIDDEPLVRIETTRVQPDETLLTTTEEISQEEMERALEREAIQQE